MRILGMLLLGLSVSLAGCTLDEGDHEQMVNLAEVKDDPASQLRNLNAAIENSERDGSLYARRAVVLLRKGELEQALEDADRAVALTKKQPSSLFVKAQVLRAMGKTEEAMPLALAAERNSFQSAPLYVLLGELYLEQKEYKKSLEQLDKAQELSPYNEFAFYYKGRVWEETGDTAKAVHNFRLALEQDPDFMEPQRELAAIMVSKGDLEQATAYLLKSKAKAKNDAKLWLTQGRIYEAVQKQDSAILAYRKAVSINDTLSGAQFKLAVFELGQGNNEEALERLEKIYKPYRSDPDYLARLASAYERNGLYSKAMETYQLLLAKDPTAVYAKRAVARLKYRIARPMPDSAAVRLQEQIER
ncbi:tetratricopeptide repeat protein [Pontibacter mangrovi]|nr:tetratricopeptide repeat protein [Pontibacter mangrovi]